MGWYKKSNSLQLIGDYISFLRGENTLDKYVADFFDYIINGIKYEEEHPEIIDEWLDGKSLKNKLLAFDLEPLENFPNKEEHVRSVYDVMNSAGHPIRDGLILVNLAKQYSRSK